MMKKKWSIIILHLRFKYLFKKFIIMMLGTLLITIYYCYLLSLFIPRMFRIMTFILLFVRNALAQDKKPYWDIYISHCLLLRRTFGASGIHDYRFYFLLSCLCNLLRYLFLWFFTKYNIDYETLDLLYLKKIPSILGDIVIILNSYSIIKITEIKINFLSLKSSISDKLRRIFLLLEKISLVISYFLLLLFVADLFSQIFYDQNVLILLYKFGVQFFRN